MQQLFCLYIYPCKHSIRHSACIHKQGKYTTYLNKYEYFFGVSPLSFQRKDIFQ